LQKLRTTGIDAGMLASVKAYVKGEFPTQELETAGQLVRVIGDLELYDQTADEINQFYAKIDAVTLDQANAVAKKYYLDTNLQFCLVGNAAKIKPDVAKYAARQKLLDIKTPSLAEASTW
jgi:predicted Zn-dependent peptidase